MLFRIGICDDQSNARNSLRLSLQQILKQEDSSYFEFSLGEGAVNWVKKHHGALDVLFLDIEMQGIDGMETARQIRNFDKDLILIFVTGYSDYVFDGYAVQALGYLLKPVNLEHLKTVLKRVGDTIAKSAQQFYTIQNADGIYRIAKREIQYIFSDKRLITVVTTLREYTFYGKLDDVQTELGADFVRIHQRYLVQVSAVEQIEGQTVLISGKALPISRALKNEATLRLARSMMGATGG